MSLTRAFLFAILLLCSGCGYHLLTPMTGGPTAMLRLGEIDDTTPWGDLGLRARDSLKLALENRTRPAVVERRGAPVMRGALTAPSHIAAGYDAQNFETTSELTVVLALRLEDERGDVLWHSGPIRRVVPWHRGRSSVDSLAAQRNAGHVAVEALVQEGVRRLLAAPPHEEAP